MTRLLEPSIRTVPAAVVAPAFDGLSTLPRLADWPVLRAKAYREPLSFQADASFLGETVLGRAYLRQGEALGLVPETVGVRVEARHEGLVLELELRRGERSFADRWEIEVDALGLLREFRSDYRTGDGLFQAEDFSRFFGALLTPLA